MPGRRRHPARPAGLVLALVLLLAGCSVGDAPSSGSRSGSGSGSGSAADSALTEGPPWASGAWLGGARDARPVEEFGRWRGDPADTLTTYPAYETWKELATSDWHVSTFRGFEGRLVYGLPLLPSEQEASLADVAAGRHDDVWRTVAQDLTDNDRDDSWVRVGLEANGTWFPWGATARTADDFKAAFRHVVEVMRAQAPELRFVFDISCSVALKGAQGDRLASLTELYPGDDWVDVVGCDHYDSYSAIARDEAEWEDTLRPPTGPGLSDVVEFAQQRGKQFAVPEWGLTTPSSEGGGDNPFFLRRMNAFFEEHQDVLAFENYFDEPAAYLQSSLFLEPQNPRSARVYRELW